MLYAVTYKRHRIFTNDFIIETDVINKEEVLKDLKLFETFSNDYALISIAPATAEDVAGKVVDFLKATAPFDYEDAKEVGETDEDIIAKLAEQLTENKDRFYDDFATFFDEPEILDSSEQEFREDILRMIKEF